jgi:hypothetical protein
MHIHLDQGGVANAPEAMNVSRLDDQNVTRPSLEVLPVDGPQARPSPDELNFVVRMAVGPGAAPRGTSYLRTAGLPDGRDTSVDSRYVS